MSRRPRRIYECKCHHLPYTVCPLCGSQYCPLYWPEGCPRASWHTSHAATPQADPPPPGAWRSIIRDTERGPFALYLLADNTPVWIDDSVVGGYPIVAYTLKGGAIVDATRARIDDTGHVASSGYDPEAWRTQKAAQ